MAATVYHGADGTISVAVESGPAGDKAKTVIDKYSLTPIGRARGVTVRVTNDVKPFHELELTRFRRGERKKEAANAKNPSTIRAGVSAPNHRVGAHGAPGRAVGP
jgi:hypothetical protein